uniref:Uncharacterized protein n=1 Tax=Aegilops tauschii subsp. strangulata TaxID=200361 RepID=A0A453AYB3_AEGTS
MGEMFRTWMPGRRLRMVVHMVGFPAGIMMAAVASLFAPFFLLRALSRSLGVLGRSASLFSFFCVVST